MLKFLFFGIIVLFSSSLQATNDLALEYIKDLSIHVPEAGSFLGLSEYDNQVGYIQKNQDDVEGRFNTRWRNRLDEELSNLKATHGNNPEEMSLESHETYVELLNLQRKCDANLKVLEQNEKYARLTIPNTYFNTMFDAIDPVMFIFIQTFLLLQERGVDAATQRFNLYLYGQNDNPPFIQGVQQYLETKIAQYIQKDKKILYPPCKQIQSMIAQANKLKFLAPFALTKLWGATSKTWHFWSQVNNYIWFLEQKILPHCTDDYALPEDLYKAYMNLQGIYVDDPKKLAEEALKHFENAHKEFSDLSIGLSAKYNTVSALPNEIMNELKIKTAVKSQNEALILYNDTAKDLENIIRNNDLFDLPESEMSVRLSGTLEGMVVQASRCTPPKVFNNHGRFRPELVLADWKNNGNKFSAHFLTAHEGRPGHELHFSSILDQEQNYLRTNLLFDFATIEGWACYAEHALLPFFAHEEQRISELDFQRFISLKAALCIQLMLGEKNQAEIKETLMTELDIPETLADTAIARFAGNLGLAQAICYYYGQQRLIKLKEELEQKLGNKFNLKEFHNAVLSYGILSIDLSAPLIERKLRGDDSHEFEM
ncbi:MAG: DUF885 family protein [Alphaproteobacteria bacterium]|nr:DUF885 family protein [Alphaproteobacteria bacterium]